MSQGAAAHNLLLLEWFANSAVCGRDGKPLPVFHGTAVKGTTFDTPAGRLPKRAFTVFDLKQMGSVSGASDAKVGFLFTSCEDRARAAASDALAVMHGDSAYIYTVYLRISRPLFVRDVRSLSPRQVAAAARGAIKAGHDGLIFECGEGPAPDYLVFDPSQIKSVDANSGAYDPGNPCICA